MLNPQFIGRVALPIFAAVFPFMIIAGQLGLDVCRWWIVYGTATMVTALMGITTFSMCNSHGPGLAVSRSWAFFWISLAALTAVRRASSTQSSATSARYVAQSSRSTRSSNGSSYP